MVKEKKIAGHPQNSSIGKKNKKDARYKTLKKPKGKMNNRSKQKIGIL